MNVCTSLVFVLKKLYESSLGIKLSQSSQRIVIRCSGQGLEPQLELDKQLLEFGPILPHSNGDEKEIVIRNPCSFPVEIYNLEFDKIYLEEEKVEKSWLPVFRCNHDELDHNCDHHCHCLLSFKLHLTTISDAYNLFFKVA